MGEVRVRSRERGGTERAEGLQTEMENCGGVCWREASVSKRGT